MKYAVFFEVSGNQIYLSWARHSASQNEVLYLVYAYSMSTNVIRSLNILAYFSKCHIPVNSMEFYEQETYL